MVDEVRGPLQQDTLGHRGRKGDPLNGIRSKLHPGQVDRNWSNLFRKSSTSSESHTVGQLLETVGQLPRNVAI